MESVTRTVRFSKKDVKRIEVFLRKNPFIDFSTLTRLAVDQFIENPGIQIYAVKSGRKTIKSSKEAMR